MTRSTRSTDSTRNRAPEGLARWADGFNAQNEMLDEHSKNYNLEDHDWRPEKPWYKPDKDD